MTVQMSRTKLLTLLGSSIVIISGFLCGCSKAKPVEANVHHMGERVQVGPLIYTVLDAEWTQHLSGGTRLPQNRFLVVKLNITNSGGRDTAIPGIMLEDLKGETHGELMDGAGVDDFLPVFRKLSPAETKEGRVLFDAPQGAYRLRVKEDADPAIEEGKEKSALIDVPLNLNAPTAIPTK